VKKFLPFWLAAIGVVLTGCVSSKYKMANSEVTPPAITLNLSTTLTSPAAT
jgi:hypothetical protein